MPRIDASGTSTKHEIPIFTVTPRNTPACVVVIHEVWGLVPHINDICKRVGKLGFAALAPNLYWRHRKLLTPDNIEGAMRGIWDLSLEERRDPLKVRKAIAKKGLGRTALETASILYSRRFRDQILADAVTCVERARSDYGRVAVLGFCLGGGLSLNVAANSGHLRSTVAFYGEPPKREDVARISSPILAIYAEQDEIINVKVPVFVKDAMESGKDLTLKTYPGTRHGFFNDTKTDLYKENAAKDAWELTRWFLERTLISH
jgi:carboxymethylenebutenolidase